jgi:hypothetical protein
MASKWLRKFHPKIYSLTKGKADNEGLKNFGRTYNEERLECASAVLIPFNTYVTKEL